MKKFKNIENGKIYTLVEVKKNVYIAMPIEKDGNVINNCDVTKFVPVSNSSDDYTNPSN